MFNPLDAARRHVHHARDKMALVRWCELPRDVDRMKSLLESTKAQIDLAAKWAIISAVSCVVLVLLFLVLGRMDQRFYLVATIGKLR